MRTTYMPLTAILLAAIAHTPGAGQDSADAVILERTTAESQTGGEAAAVVEEQEGGVVTETADGELMEGEAAGSDSAAPRSPKQAPTPAISVEPRDAAEALIVEDESDVSIVDDRDEPPGSGAPEPAPGPPRGEAGTEGRSSREAATDAARRRTPSGCTSGSRRAPRPPGYRSPKLAMLLSLAVPGLGQAYTKCYWRAALYAVAEIAVVSVSAGLSRKGREKHDEARRFADHHYDVDKFMAYYRTLKAHIEDVHQDKYTDYHNPYVSDPAEWLRWEIYWYPKERNDDAPDTTLLRRELTGDGFYDHVGQNRYVHGWDDAEPRLSDTPGALFEADGYGEIGDSSYSYRYRQSDWDTTWLLDAYDRTTGEPVAELAGLYGYSAHQKRYKDMVAESNLLHKRSIGVLPLLLANHVVSVVDALITARAYNERLRGRRSMWERVHLDQQVAFDGVGLTTEIALKVGF